MKASARPLHVLAGGMACPVGLHWMAACAAMRAGIDRKRELPYLDGRGEPIVASHLASLGVDKSAAERRLFFLAHAVEDVARQVGPDRCRDAALLVTWPADIAEPPPTAERLAADLAARTGVPLHPRQLRVVSEGATGPFAAMVQARDLLARRETELCLVATSDSLVSRRRLAALQAAGRLLSDDNADGVIPGEAAGCLALSVQPDGALATIVGLGLGREPALLDNDVPLRAAGGIAAARAALAEAGLGLHEIDFRLCDAAGESYHFKEQALVASRLLRERKPSFPLWLAAETLGDTGVAAGLCGVLYALHAFARGYAPGPRAIAFASDEAGQRAALVLEQRSLALGAPQPRP